MFPLRATTLQNFDHRWFSYSYSPSVFEIATLALYGKKAGFAHCEGIHPLQAVVSPAQPCLEFGVIKKFVSVCLFRFFASPYQC